MANWVKLLRFQHCLICVKCLPKEKDSTLGLPTSSSVTERLSCSGKISWDKSFSSWLRAQASAEVNGLCSHSLIFFLIGGRKKKSIYCYCDSKEIYGYFITKANNYVRFKYLSKLIKQNIYMRKSRLVPSSTIKSSIYRKKRQLCTCEPGCLFPAGQTATFICEHCSLGKQDASEMKAALQVQGDIIATFIFRWNLSPNYPLNYTAARGTGTASMSYLQSCVVTIYYKASSELQTNGMGMKKSSIILPYTNLLPER